MVDGNGLPPKSEEAFRRDIVEIVTHAEVVAAASDMRVTDAHKDMSFKLGIPIPGISIDECGLPVPPDPDALEEPGFVPTTVLQPGVVVDLFWGRPKN